MFGRTRPCPCFIGRHHFLTKIEDLQGWLRHFQFSRLFFTCFTSNCWTIYARNVSQQSLCLLVPMAGNRVSPLRRSQSVFLRVVATCLPTPLCASCCAVIAF